MVSLPTHQRSLHGEARGQRALAGGDTRRQGGPGTVLRKRQGGQPGKPRHKLGVMGEMVVVVAGTTPSMSLPQGSGGEVTHGPPWCAAPVAAETRRPSWQREAESV